MREGHGGEGDGGGHEEMEMMRRGTNRFWHCPCVLHLLSLRRRRLHVEPTSPRPSDPCLLDLYSLSIGEQTYFSEPPFVSLPLYCGGTALESQPVKSDKLQKKKTCVIQPAAPSSRLSSIFLQQMALH